MFLSIDAVYKKELQTQRANISKYPIRENF